MFSITTRSVLLDCVSSANYPLPLDEARIALLNRESVRESLPLLPTQNEVAVVDLQLVNQLRDDELMPDSVA